MARLREPFEIARQAHDSLLQEGRDACAQALAQSTAARQQEPLLRGRVAKSSELLWLSFLGLARPPKPGTPRERLARQRARWGRKEPNRDPRLLRQRKRLSAYRKDLKKLGTVATWSWPALLRRLEIGSLWVRIILRAVWKGLCAAWKAFTLWLNLPRLLFYGAFAFLLYLHLTAHPSLPRSFELLVEELYRLELLR